MLISHVSFSLALIALVTGTCLYLWSVRAEPGSGIGLARVIGILVMILAILMLLCSVYYAMSGRHLNRELHEFNAPEPVAPASPPQPQTVIPQPDNNSGVSNSDKPSQSTTP